MDIEQEGFLLQSESMGVDRSSIRSYIYGLQDELEKMRDANQKLLEDIRLNTRQIAALRVDGEWEAKMEERLKGVGQRWRRDFKVEGSEDILMTKLALSGDLDDANAKIKCWNRR